MATVALPLFYESLAKSTAGIYSGIAKKLQAEFPCLAITAGPGPSTHGGGWKRRVQHAAPPPEKPKIGTRELSREALAKKEFFGIINKIAPQNKDAILKKLVFRDEFLDAYIKFLWDALLRSPEYQELYMDVLAVIANHFAGSAVCESIERVLWIDYIQERRWLFAPASDGEEYNDFCDHVKLKKQIVASVNAWALLTRNKYINIIDKLFDMVYDECNSRLKKFDFSKTVEILLETLYEFKDRRSHDIIAAAITDTWYEIIKDPDCPPVIRFKVYDFVDLLKIDVDLEA